MAWWILLLTSCRNCFPDRPVTVSIQRTTHAETWPDQHVRINPRKSLLRATMLRSRGFFRGMFSEVVLELQLKETSTSAAFQVFLAA